MDVCRIFFIAGIVVAVHQTAASPLVQLDDEQQVQEPIIPVSEAKELLKSKNIDGASTIYFLRLVINEAQALWNPCNLVDRVQESMKKVSQKTKFNALTQNTPALDTATVRRKVLDMALPAIREGISLFRTQFILQQTKNLTVFLDQNRDGLYSNTSLRNYSHYYIRASTEEITQILFIGLISTDDLLVAGTEAPAMQFLTVNGLINHPRQYIDFSTIPIPEAKLILDKRQQMADLLSTQDTFWSDDIEYLTNILTVAFNGPENEKEQTGIMPKILKNFMHRMQDSVPSPSTEKYDSVCLHQSLQKAADQATMEAVAFFAL